ncbi:intelectin 1 precursor [Ictalurus punctatus]|uniref:Intelectin 1 n=1 Tax=Ictalurus punctatus TaxID=7998 RepID=B1NQM4_ICTPU|nr:intelectin 1 precursor [Ictalurus punctatus]ABW07846.1 intelectin 1 [Ictalurus punctatus]
MANWILLLVALASLNLSLCKREPEYFSPRSCKELMERYKTEEDGLYYLTSPTGVVYQTYCDMTTAGGGWTLVASVHENNLYGKCTTGDRWSSQQRGSPNVPDGDGSWSNTVTFGNAEAATSDDFKNPGYYDITAENVAVWHVPNNERVGRWKLTSFLRYHTESKFLRSYGGNLYNLFKIFPVKYNAGSCPANHGPSVPVVYDVGDASFNHKLFGPHVRGETEPGFITFRAINNERAAMAICLGVKPKGCNTEHSCIGGGGHFPEASPRQCGDFASFDWDGYGTNAGWSASKQVTGAAVLLFYR